MRITSRTLAYAAAIVLLAYAAFFVLPPLLNPAAPTPTPTPAAEAHYAKANDTVFVDYSLWVENGTLYATSIESVARAAGIYRPGATYSPMNFTIGKDQVIKGFEQAVIGMKVGDEKNVTVLPADAYGDYDVSAQEAASETYSLPRVEPVPLGQFMAAFPNFNASENQTIDMGGFNATVLAVTNETVTIRSDPEVNQSLPRPASAIPEVVANVTDTLIIVKRVPQAGMFYLWTDASGTTQLAQVKWVRDGVVMLDYNPPLAGHTLNFTIKLVSIANSS